MAAPRPAFLRLFRPAGLLLLALLGAAVPGRAASVAVQIDPSEARVGDQVDVTVQIQNGSVQNVQLPPVDGLEVAGKSTSQNITIINGSFSRNLTYDFTLIPQRAGDFTIPAFDLPTDDGQKLHVNALHLHVVDDNGPSSAPANAPAAPPSGPGPVVFPPAGGNGPGTAGAPNASAPSGAANPNVPMDPTGRRPEVFMVITPQTTDGYVGESIPLKIEFYIHLDVMAGQDSLPTILGSDFLMNPLSIRFRQDELLLDGQPYRHETWTTAISAPKPGDFPLKMKRDTYWAKNSAFSNRDPFGNIFFGRPSLAHGPIESNPCLMHIHPLPDEGRPPGFSGAIGQFQASATASAQTAGVGEPLTLRFIVSGIGNFDYVKCPVLAADPAWKTYRPEARTEFQDESHTQAVKTFEQALIPQKPGTLPLPAADFSYFDPAKRQYVTVPITLPAITVTGSAPPAAEASSAADTNAAAAAAPPPPRDPNQLAPQRADPGQPHPLAATPARDTLFWAVQAATLLLFLAAAFARMFRPSAAQARARQAEQERDRRLRDQERQMGEASARGDAAAFFPAARAFVQGELAKRWRLSPGAVTPAEIARRHPALAEALAPFFAAADDALYSGQLPAAASLPDWERRVRQALTLPSP